MTTAVEQPPKSKEPPNTAFRQQRLRAWQPILTPKVVIASFFVIGIIFIALGAIIFAASSSVIEIMMDYTICTAPSDGSSPIISMTSNGSHCTITFSVGSTMKGPVFMYYRLTNFYQNHRRYVRSVDYDQLRGVAVSLADLQCGQLNGPSDNSNRVYYPCGLIANSYFLDEIGNPQAVPSNTIYPFSATGITWSSDAQKYQQTKYTPDQYVLPPNWQNYSSRFVNNPIWANERFQVWMRPAGLPTFRKLYGWLNQDLPVSNYQIVVSLDYDVTSFKGTKSIVLSTASWMGGRNSFLGIAYIIVGCICLIIGFLFLLRHMMAPRHSTTSSVKADAPRVESTTQPLAVNSSNENSPEENTTATSGSQSRSNSEYVATSGQKKESKLFSMFRFKKKKNEENDVKSEDNNQSGEIKLEKQQEQKKVVENVVTSSVKDTDVIAPSMKQSSSEIMENQMKPIIRLQSLKIHTNNKIARPLKSDLSVSVEGINYIKKSTPTSSSPVVEKMRNRTRSAQQPEFQTRPLSPARRNVIETSSVSRLQHHDGKDQVNQYTILSDIGQGSFGMVKICEDSITKEQFAMKMISKKRVRKKLMSANASRKPSMRHRTRSRLNSGMTSSLDSFTVPESVKISDPSKTVEYNSPNNSSLRRKPSKLGQSCVSGNDSPPTQSASLDFMDSIRREIAILKKISNHPNIASLIEVLDDKQEDMLYMVFELCERPLMKLKLNERVKCYSEDQARKYFRDIVLGLEYMHFKKIIHHDIKPENLLIDKTGVVKISDFGVSYLMKEDQNTFIEDESTGGEYGSPAFTPPEYCVADQNPILLKRFKAQVEADIWALGVTLYAMVHGILPFASPSIVTLYEKIAKEDIVIDDHISDELADLLLAMLRKDFNTRIEMAEIRYHPWVTSNGKEPLISNELNVNRDDTVTEEEISKAVKPAVTFFNRLISRLKSTTSRGRTMSSNNWANDGSEQNLNTKTSREFNQIRSSTRERTVEYDESPTQASQSAQPSPTVALEPFEPLEISLEEPPKILETLESFKPSATQPLAPTHHVNTNQEDIAAFESLVIPDPIEEQLFSIPPPK